jgi:branched-chain amino acid aminotransferase
MKAYKDESDDVWLFAWWKLQTIQQFSIQNGNARGSWNYFHGWPKRLLKIDEAWIKKRKRNTLYIRPFMIATGEVANPSDNYKFMIILSPAKSYYSGE